MYLRNSEDGLVNFNFSSFKTGFLNWRAAMGGILDFRQYRTKWRFLFIELFVALSLSAAYYFLVKNFAAGSQNNYTNFWTFTSCSIPGFHLQTLGIWRGRLSGVLLSGWLFDSLLKDGTFQMDQYFRIFGLYQAFWLFLLFSAVIFAMRHSLFINLGIFAGLMFNFSPAGLYFSPWELPATLFFTLAVLFFERRQMWLMTAATCAGCFFKETVLLCALLVFFCHGWKWWKRLLLFMGMVLFYLLVKKALVHNLNFAVPLMSIGDQTNLAKLFPRDLLLANLKLLATPSLNHPMLFNGGTLFAVLIMGWRQRFLPYMLLIAVFVAAHFLITGFGEAQHFIQILPLSLILLSERWQEYAGTGATGESSGETAPAWAVRETLPVLVPLAIVLIVVTTGIAAQRYYIIAENLQPGRLAHSELGRHAPRPEGNVSDLATENQLLRERYIRAELELATVSLNNRQFTNAIMHYQQILELDTNSVPALNNLAWLQATAPDPALRNGNEAVRLAKRACELTGYKDAVQIAILAAAYAEEGRFEDAVANAQKAHELALANGQTEIAAKNEQLLELFESRQPYRLEAKPAP